MSEVERVYLNLIKMFGYRGLTEIGKQLLPNEIVHQMHHYGYVVASASNGPLSDSSTTALTVILVEPNSKYSTKSAEYIKLVTKLTPPKQSNHKAETNIMFVAQESPSSHIKKKIMKYQEMLAARGSSYYEHYTYDLFLIEIPLHKSVPRHEIANPEEITEVCNYFRLMGERFPKISCKDPPVVWIGARPGQYVKIWRDSETAGEAIAYRFVLP